MALLGVPGQVPSMYGLRSRANALSPVRSHHLRRIWGPGFSVLALAVLLPCAVPAAAQQGPQQNPRVVVLTTGGTIASRSDAPMLEGNALVRAVPALLDHADVAVEEVSRVGSSQMTPSHWLLFARRINELFDEDPGLSGIVVTHGTDTLEETAFFLNLSVRDDRPVVLVGAMRSANEISADGPANLLGAVRVAVDPASRGNGVLVVLNEDAAAARDVWKTHNRRVETFRSPELGFLGVVDPDAVVFYRTPTRPHTTQAEFDLAGVDSLPRVEIVSDYAGFDGAALSEAIGRRPQGIVFATFAGGRASAAGRAGMRSATEAGIPFVTASRVPGGRIVGEWPPEQGLVARDLPPHKARILLMLALTTGDPSPDDLQAIFDRY